MFICFAGSIHAGIGEREQLNNLLSSMNIHPITQSLWTRLQQCEVGPALSKVAKESVVSALQEEHNATVAAGESGGVTLSVDGGWQSRGSGRSYNSASGHATAIGQRTGMCVGYSIRSKACRICKVAKTKNTPPRVHNCVHNWHGSSKAMEPDMIIEMVKEASNCGVKVKTLVGDEDSTTIARVRREVDNEIQKGSDYNHICKILGNTLHELKNKKKHKSLTNTVIKYLQTMYSYALKQNQGNSTGLSAAILSIIPHAFGNHDGCTDHKWCRWKHSPTTYKHASLPHGKDLVGETLKRDLTEIFKARANEAHKLVILGSTQANESMNMTVSSKANKRIHFSESTALTSRVEAAVAQKNFGYDYVPIVNNELLLSPGKFTHQHAVNVAHDRERKRQNATSKEGKIKRRFKKQLRCQSEAAREVREGPTYQTNVAIVEDENLEAIPTATRAPSITPVERYVEEVFFDLETTGLGMKPNIIQIAAKTNCGDFDAYVKPLQGFIPKLITNKTGISIKDDNMFYNHEKVASLDLREALVKFVEFLPEKCLLVAHNTHNFDSRILLQYLRDYLLLDEFEAIVCAFLDTYPLAKSLYPERKCHKQEVLVLDLMKESYVAHNAIADVYALYKLFLVMKQLPLFMEYFANCTRSLQSAVDILDHQLATSYNLKTLDHLVANDILKPEMAKKVAASGLQLCHLKIASNRSATGIRDLFSELTVDNQPRVSKSKKIWDRVQQYLEKTSDKM